MKLINRVVATSTAVLSITALALPMAGAEAASSRNDNGKIRVCVQGLRGGEADVYVAGRHRSVDSGDCTTFRGLRAGRTYRVVADADRGCRIYDDRKSVTAKRDGRTVVFYGRCFDRNGNGNNNGGWNGNNNGNNPGNNNGPGRGPR